MSRFILSVFATTLCWTCGGSTTDLPVDTAGRESFMSVYLDLRVEALDLGSSLIGQEVRDSILAVHDVTEQELRDFVDLHGEDVQFMNDLRSEVEARLTERVEEEEEEEEEEEARDEAAAGTDDTDDAGGDGVGNDGV